MRAAAIVAAALALAACGSAPKPELVGRTVEVKVPVAVPCVPADLPGEPAYVDSDAALKGAPNGPTRYRLTAAGRIQRNQYLAIVRPVLKACQRSP
jgi:hypothetical protein